MGVDRVAKAVATAREFLAEKKAKMAVYVLRDLPELEEVGLRDIAWGYFSPDYCGWVPLSEAKWLVDEFEKRRSSREVKEGDEQ